MDVPMFTTLRFDPEYFTEERFCALKQSIQKTYSEKGFDGVVNIFRHPVLQDLLVIPNFKSAFCNESDCEQYIVVDHLCGAAILRGAHCFAPGILCLSASAKLNEMVSVYADIEGKCLKGSKQYSGQKYFVGRGILLVDRNMLFSSAAVVSGIGVKMTRPLIIAPSLMEPDMSFGFRIYPQNLPSVICGHVLDVDRCSGLNVLDMCAGPGGKLSHLGQLIQENVRLIGLEKSANRYAKTLDLLENLGIRSKLELYHYDATEACSVHANKLTDGNPPPFYPGSFHRILLDAPCSGTGQRPRLMDRWTNNQMNSFSKVQKKLFKTAVDLLCEDGILVYSTCSVDKSENEDMVTWALKTFKEELNIEAQQPSISPYSIAADGSDAEPNPAVVIDNRLDITDNPGTFCHIGRDIVQDILTKCQELFSRLRMLSDPRSFSTPQQRMDELEQIKAYLEQIHKNKRVLRVVFARVLEATSKLPIQNAVELVPFVDDDNEIRTHQNGHNTEENKREFSNETSLLESQLSEVNQKIDTIRQHLTSTVWQINDLADLST